MPKIILPAKSTDEMNDVLGLRYELLEESGVVLDGLSTLGRRVVDALDLYPDTLNLVAYRDAVAIGTARFMSFRARDPLLRGVHDFDDAAVRLEGRIAFVDWLGLRNDALDAQAVAASILEYGMLLLARRPFQHLLGSIPEGVIQALGPAGLERLAIRALGPAVLIPGGGRSVPVAVDLQKFYQRWVASIRDREVLRFQDLFYFSLFEPGEILFVQGERGTSAHVIQEGEVEIVLQKDDRIIPIGTLSGSQLIGEIAMITQEVRTASLLAKTRVRCITMDRQAFLGALDREPHLSMDIFKIFSKRISEANQRIAQATRPGGNA